MFDFIMAEDSELMDINLNGPHTPIKEVKEGEVTKMVVNSRRVYNDKDKKGLKRITRQETVVHV